MNVSPSNSLRVGGSERKSSDIVASPSWMIAALTVIGFCYVTLVLCGRHNLLQTAHGSGFDLPIAVLFTILLTALWRIPFIGKNETRVSLEACSVPFLAAWFFGLNWQVVIRITRIDFTLAPSGIRGATAVVIALVVISLLLIGSILFHLALAKRAGVFSRLLALLLLPQAIIACITFALRKTHYLHYHHYLFAATLLPLACFRHPASRLAQGFLLGLFIEGAARWGFDPVWIAR